MCKPQVHRLTLHTRSARLQFRSQQMSSLVPIHIRTYGLDPSLANDSAYKLLLDVPMIRIILVGDCALLIGKSVILKLCAVLSPILGYKIVCSTKVYCFCRLLVAVPFA